MFNLSSKFLLRVGVIMTSIIAMGGCDSNDVVSSVLIDIRTLEDTSANSQHALVGPGNLTITPYDMESNTLYNSVSFDLSSGQGDVPALPLGRWRFYVTGNQNGNPMFGMSTPFEVTDYQALSSVTIVGRSRCTGLLPSISGPTNVGGSTDLARDYDGSAALTLPDGRIIITGGGTIDRTSGRLTSVSRDIQIYDPDYGVVLVAPQLLSVPRAFHQMTLLKDGRVLITGGVSAITGVQYLATDTAELITIAQDGTLQVGASISMGVPRYDHMQLELEDDYDSVLIAGGRDSTGAILRSVTRFIPEINLFAAQGDMNSPRVKASANKLQGILAVEAVIMGGLSDTGPTSSIEFFETSPSAGCVPIPDPNQYRGCFSLSGTSLNRPRWGHQTALLKNRSILIVGGFQAGNLDNPSEAIPLIEQFKFVSAGGSANILVQDGVGTLDLARGSSALATLTDPSGDHLVVVGGEAAGSRSEVTIINPVNLEMDVASNVVVSPTCPLSEDRYNPMAVQTQEGSVMIFGGVKRGRDPNTNGIVYIPSRRVEVVYPEMTSDLRPAIPGLR